ncbi:MAG: hypothetical protein QW699_00285 [Metallosphaera sp.]|jgi:hypothetical protein|uniref:hypothetical protein n=1 Tax=Saccharolobus sp. TaxID=2100761 RepID=UPI0031640952
MELEEAQKIYEVLKEEGVKYGQMITGNYKVVVDALDAAYMKEIYIYLQNHIVYINWKKLRIETRASEVKLSLELKKKIRLYIYPLDSEKIRIVLR